MAHVLLPAGIRIAPHPVRMAGILFNIGNVLLFLTPLVLGHVRAFVTYADNPLPPLAASLFFVSGVIYSLNRFKTGNRLSATAAALLAADLFLRGQIAAGAIVLVLHAGGKFVGAFPDTFARWLGERGPSRAAGLGPLLSRIPVAADAAQTGNWLLCVACFFWLAADLCLAGARGNDR